ncbi:minor capsid protein [Vagococcus fluvialis]|uniref:phage tail terminator protein n=1 Tax=Vagococcus fluvialis TaxID=2738 RepID=UPI0032E42653
MDFMERLVETVNKIPQIPIKCSLGYLSTDESFCMYPIPGSIVNRIYYDGAKDQQLNYEFAMKSKSQRKVNNTLWLVQNHLEELSDVKSSDGSFDFDEVIISNKPYINQLDETKFYIFALTIQASITTKKN